MSHAWLIESLAELRDHAGDLGLSRLSRHLDDAIALAHLEIASTEAALHPPQRRSDTPHQNDEP